MRRRSAVPLLVLAALVAHLAVAEAHGGPVVYNGEAGPYRVEARRLFGVSGEQDILNYSLYLRTAAGRPVENATVQVTLQRAGEVYGPQDATRFANHYEGQFAVPTTDGPWTAEVAIDGPEGLATYTHTLAPTRSLLETVTPWLAPLLVIVVLWMVARVMRQRRRLPSA